VELERYLDASSGSGSPLSTLDPSSGQHLKTTIGRPDDLARKAEARAARKQTRLRTEIEEAIRAVGFRRSPSPAPWPLRLSRSDPRSTGRTRESTEGSGEGVSLADVAGEDHDREAGVARVVVGAAHHRAAGQDLAEHPRASQG